MTPKPKITINPLPESLNLWQYRSSRRFAREAIEIWDKMGLSGDFAEWAKRYILMRYIWMAGWN